MTKKPNKYKVSSNLYCILIISSLIGLIISKTIIELNNPNCADIISNISIGCLASAIVALLIEIRDVKEKNNLFEMRYDSIYSRAWLQLINYMKCWADYCLFLSETKEKYKMEKHTWKEWFEISQSIYKEVEDTLKHKYMNHIITFVKMYLKQLKESVQNLLEQQILLKINELSDSDTEDSIIDYEYIFQMMNMLLSQEDIDYEYFWELMRHFNEDLHDWIQKEDILIAFDQMSFQPRVI